MWEPVAVGSLEIQWATIIYALAVVLATIVVFTDYKRFNIPKKEIIPAMVWGIPAAVIGGKIFFLIFFTDRGITSDFISEFSNEGSMYYGVEIFGLSAAMLYVIKNKLNLWGALDLSALFLFVAHGVGRVGCFGSGCCYGTPTDSFLGIIFPNSIVAVHPTQLYEASILLFAFGIIWLLRKRIKIHGLIYCIYVMFYSVARFSIEFIRDDASKMGTGFLNISPSQYIAIIMFFFAAGLMIYLIKKHENEQTLAST